MGRMERRARRSGESVARAVPDGVGYGSWHESCAKLVGIHILITACIALAVYTARGVVTVKQTVPTGRAGFAPNQGTAGSGPTGSFAMDRTRGFGSDGFLRNGKDPRVRVRRVLRKSAELRVRFGS